MHSRDSSTPGHNFLFFFAFLELILAVSCVPEVQLRLSVQTLDLHQLCSPALVEGTRGLKTVYTSKCLCSTMINCQ